MWPLPDLPSEGPLVTGWTTITLVQLVFEHAVDIMGLFPGLLLDRHVPVRREEPPPLPLGLGALGTHQGDCHLCPHDVVYLGAIDL